MTGDADRGFHVRASMTFSEEAHPAFVRTLRGLSPRGRSRLIHALVERGLSMTSAAGRQDAGSIAVHAPGGNGSASPLHALGSPGALAGAEEFGP